MNKLVAPLSELRDFFVNNLEPGGGMVLDESQVKNRGTFSSRAFGSNQPDRFGVLHRMVTLCQSPASVHPLQVVVYKYAASKVALEWGCRCGSRIDRG